MEELTKEDLKQLSTEELVNLKLEIEELLMECEEVLFDEEEEEE